MSLLINKNAVDLWQEVIKHAENKCSIMLKEELETYLISLLIRYTNKPEVAKQIFAMAFLEALHLHSNERKTSLQHLGDQCLLFAGLFPHAAQKRHVKISYFVDVGRAAYSGVSGEVHDLYWTLACQFVAMMDVLQSIREYPDLLPLEAYEQWEEVRSKRALQILREYTQAIPIKGIRR